MSYTLLRDCSVLIAYKGTGYQFDALSELSFGQTLARTTNTRKTLHSKRAKANTIIPSKNAANISMDVVCTDTFIESIFFDMLGMEYKGHYKYRYQNTNEVTPRTCEIYIVSKYDVYKLAPAVLETLDLPLSISSAGTISVSFTCGNMDLVQTVPLLAGLELQGNPIPPTPIQFKYNNTLNNSIVNAGISFKQDVTWRNDRGLHDIGTLYHYSKPILNDTSVTATITTHLRNAKRQTHEPEMALVELYQSGVYFLFKNALVTKRITTEDIFMEGYDVALTEQTDVFVEYGGLVT